MRAWPSSIAELTEDARRVLALEGYDLDGAEFRYAADLRYVGPGL